MKRKPTANAGNGGAEAWSELPMATMNEAVGTTTVGMWNGKTGGTRTNKDHLNVDGNTALESTLGQV